MCVYSMVSKYVRCNCFPQWGINTLDTAIPMPGINYPYESGQRVHTPEEQLDQMRRWQDFFEAAKLVDAATGQPDCKSEEGAAEKVSTEALLKARIYALEEMLGLHNTV